MRANVRCKLPVALQFEVALHFIEGFANGHTRRFESPVTFGATKTPKTLLVNPYQLPAHDRLFRCAPANTCALSGDETFCFAINKLFRSGVLTDCSRKPAQSGHGGRYIRSCIKRWAEFTRVPFGWSVVHPTYAALPSLGAFSATCPGLSVPYCSDSVSNPM